MSSNDISDEQIVQNYLTNGHLTSDNIRRLYGLVKDPWNFNSEENVKDMDRLVEILETEIDFNHLDYFIDYGCGTGVLLRAVKSKYPHIKTVGIDFKEALEHDLNISKYIDHPVKLENGETEQSFIDKTKKMGYWITDSNKIAFCSLNALYYLFTNVKDNKTKVSTLSDLIKYLTWEVTPEYGIVINSGFSYGTGNNAIRNLGLKMCMSTSLMIDNPNPKFRATLDIKVFRKR